MNNNGSQLTIRPETPNDWVAVQRVTADAFSNSEYGHNGEAELVQSLRKSSASVSLVALLGTELVGHVLLSEAEIRINDERHSGLGLAPISVATKHQRQGIGSSLMKAAVEAASQKTSEFVIVLGEPAFYSRFGFRPAADYGVSHGFAGIPQAPFLLLPLCDDAFQDAFENAAKGQAYYHAAFGPQHSTSL